MQTNLTGGLESKQLGVALAFCSFGGSSFDQLYMPLP